MRLSPVSASASIRRTLSATGIIFFSDWKPSRGPSSSINTRLGRSDMGVPPRWREASAAAAAWKAASRRPWCRVDVEVNNHLLSGEPQHMLLTDLGLRISA